MKSELDLLWRTPPKIREKKQKEFKLLNADIKYDNPMLESKLKLLYEETLEKYSYCNPVAEDVMHRMFGNLIQHMERYKTFCHEEDYIKDVTMASRKDQVMLVFKTDIKEWNKNRRKSESIRSMAENSKW